MIVDPRTTRRSGPWWVLGTSWRILWTLGRMKRRVGGKNCTQTGGAKRRRRIRVSENIELREREK